MIAHCPFFSESETNSCIVERLFSSSLMALIKQGSPRKLQVSHFKKGTEICSYSYPNTVLSVQLNRSVSKLYDSCENYHEYEISEYFYYPLCECGLMF